MRYKSCSLVFLAATAIVLISACGGGGAAAPPASSTPAPIVINHVLPTGDTFSKSGTPWDIVAVRTSLFESSQNTASNVYDSLTVAVTFSQDVSSVLPAPGASFTLGTQLGLGIQIKTSPSAIMSTAPYNCITQNNADFDYFSNVSSRQTDGNFAILNASGSPVNQQGNPTTEAQTVVTGNTISETFRLGVLGVTETTTAPLLGVDVDALNGVYNNGFQTTDCAPRNVELYLTK